MKLKKHLIIGQFNVDQLREIASFLDTQETTDRATNTIIHLDGEYGVYLIMVDDQGLCQVLE